MTRNVAIYARVSTEHEAQLSALENQVQYYDDLLARHPEWVLYKRYIDEGITGTSVKKRKNFMKMMEDAEAGMFDLIITREVSRFARNTVDTLQETRKLKRMGVEVYFTEDNIHTLDDEDGELRLTIMATLAQNESKKTSQRVKVGMKISMQNGVFYGTGNILGYDKIGKDMVINEEQAKTVKYIFKSFLNGKGTTDIKYELEEKGILTATGLKKWAASSIVRILENPFYCGTIVYRKSFIPDYLEQKPKKNTGQVDKIIIEGRHEPIISKEDFEKVQKLLKKHSMPLNKKRDIGRGIPKSIWSKKLECSCGSTLNRCKYHKTDDYISYCYQCYNQKNNGSKKVRLKRGLDITGACDEHLVQEWKLEVMANVIFKTIWDDTETIVKVANNLIEETVNQEDINNEIQEEIYSCNNKIKVNQDKLDKLLDMYLNELVEKDKYIVKKKELESNLSILNNKLEELKSNIKVTKETVLNKMEKLRYIVNNALNTKQLLSEKLIDNYVDKIKIDGDVYKWKLNYLEGIKSEDSDVFLTRVIINKDNLEELKEYKNEYNKVKLKESLIADIYL